MRKVSAKIIFMAFLIVLVSSIVPRVLFGIYNVSKPTFDIDTSLLYITGFLSVFTSITLFSIFLNAYILKRIKALNIATRRVMQGNYDFTLKMTDQDEISELTNNFNRMVKELQSNEYISKEFIRNITHELKTPLSAINGYSELIHTGDLSAEEIKAYSGIIASESKRLSFLAKDILQISLVEYKTIEQHGESFKISEQIRTVLQLMQLTWENKGIEFDLTLDEFKCTSNKEITYQIWTNLISNAIKFSEEGSTIQISLKVIQQDIVFSISNPGHLSEEEQNSVFKLFYVAKKSQGRESNGVGLTLTAKIIERLKGSIHLTSDQGLVTVNVSLPLE